LCGHAQPLKSWNILESWNPGILENPGITHERLICTLLVLQVVEEMDEPCEDEAGGFPLFLSTTVQLHKE
jgi:hypothetical protein